MSKKKNISTELDTKTEETMMEFVNDTIPYLKQYRLRIHSKSHKKRWFGWRVEQRREDRINTALSCI